MHRPTTQRRLPTLLMFLLLIMSLAPLPPANASAAGSAGLPLPVEAIPRKRERLGPDEPVPGGAHDGVRAPAQIPAPAARKGTGPASGAGDGQQSPADEGILPQPPLSFTPNRGQASEDVLFEAQGLGGRILFAPHEIVLLSGGLPAEGQEQGGEAHMVRLRFEGAAPDTTVEPGARRSGRVSYLIGSRQAGWQTGLPTYADITYRQLYAGVDLTYDGAGGKLKGTYTIAPGADPTQISWSYEGAQNIAIDAQSGDLHITLGEEPLWQLVEDAPIAWQEREGRHIPVAVRYALSPDQSVRFAVESYDPSLPLIIDPTISVNAPLPGGAANTGLPIAIDNAGALYMAGTMPRFPTNPYDDEAELCTRWQSGSPSGFYNGICYDLVLTKLSPSGREIIYQTTLGGTHDDVVSAFGVDAEGAVYLAGHTNSADLPTAGPPQGSYQGGYCAGSSNQRRCHDAFLLQVSRDGSAVEYGSYIGGSRDDYATGLAWDQVGNIYLAGYTDSANFPTHRAKQPTNNTSACEAAPSWSDYACHDGFVLKLLPDGSAVVFSTYLGGEHDDTIRDLAVSTTGEIVVVGSTRSATFPTASALYATHQGHSSGCSSEGASLPITWPCNDAFVTKLSGDGQSLLLSTYLGGYGSDSATALALGADDTIYLGGTTNSSNFPIKNAFQPSHISGIDLFLARMTSTGSELLASSFLGHTGDESLGALHVAPDGSIFLAGSTTSTNMPLFGPPHLSSSAGQAALIVKLDPQLKRILYGARLGNVGTNTASGLALDGSGNLYLSGYSNYLPGLPLTNPLPPEGRYNGAFLAKLHFAPMLVVNRLRDDQTGLPLAGVAGSVELYQQDELLERVPFLTDATGVYTVTFSGHTYLTAGLRHTGIAGYPAQFHHARAQGMVAERLALREGVNLLSTPLARHTTLTSTLRDDVTGLPIQHLTGTVGVYSGTLPLDHQTFTTGADGSFTATFSNAISGTVVLSYTLPGYQTQWFNRTTNRLKAQPVLLRPGQNTLDTPARLRQAVTLVTTLRDDSTGLPVANTSGTLYSYDTTRSSYDREPHAFTTDASGIYTVTLRQIPQGPIKLEYENIKGFVRQFHGPSNPASATLSIPVSPGQQLNHITSRLARPTTLTVKLVDDVTGAPIVTPPESFMGLARSATDIQHQETVRITSTLDGIYTITSTTIISGDHRIFHRIPGYTAQYAGTTHIWDDAEVFHLKPGINALRTIRVRKPTTLINTLVDEVNGMPIPHASVWFGLTHNTGPVSREMSTDFWTVTTDANGTFTIPLDTVDPFMLSYRVGTYPRQYYDRRRSLAQGDLIADKGGVLRLTTRLARAPTLTGTLHDRLTGEPLADQQGTVVVYTSDGQQLKSPLFTTNAQGQYTVSFSTLINESVKIQHDMASTSRYADQFYHNAAALAQATPLLLKPGANAIATSLLPSVQLTNRLVNTQNLQPMANQGGKLYVYSGTLELEEIAFKTDASGVFTATIQKLGGQSPAAQHVRLGYLLDGYEKNIYGLQYHDQAASLEAAQEVGLSPGGNRLTTHLQPSMVLITRLRDGDTNTPAARVGGGLEIYSDTVQLAVRYFQTDAQGVFTTTLPHGDGVRIKFRTNTYAPRFYQEGNSVEEADELFATHGTQAISMTLYRDPKLSLTVLDDATGRPAYPDSWKLLFYDGTTLLHTSSNTTDSTGSSMWPTGLPLALVGKSLRLEVRGDRYPNQFYNGSFTLGGSTPFALTTGANHLTLRLRHSTTLVNTLLDAETGQPIRNREGVLQVITGTTALGGALFRTDAYGVYTATLTTYVSGTVQLKYQNIYGYVRRHHAIYHDRAITQETAMPVLLREGTNQVTTRLQPATTLVNYLVDDRTGAPLSDIWISYTVYSGTQTLVEGSGSLPADGAIRLTLDGPITPEITIGYKGHFMTPYPGQYYDRTFIRAQARPVQLQLGTNYLTSRLLVRPTLVNTLLDDHTGAPMTNTSGTLSVYSGTLLLESQRFTTDDSGVYQVTLTTPVSGPLALEHSAITGYVRQYHDRTLWLDQVRQLPIRAGTNTLTPRLIPGPTLRNQLLDHGTGEPITNTAGILTVYLGDVPLEQADFRTDNSGVFTATFSTFVDQQVHLRYSHVGSYPAQYHELASRRALATPVLLGRGATSLVTRLGGRAEARLRTQLLHARGGPPLANLDGSLRIYEEGNLLRELRFSTDAGGVFTATLTEVVSQSVQLEYQVEGFEPWYYDRKQSLEQADELFVHAGLQQLAVTLEPTRRWRTLLPLVWSEP